MMNDRALGAQAPAGREGNAMTTIDRPSRGTYRFNPDTDQVTFEAPPVLIAPEPVAQDERPTLHTGLYL